MICACGKSFWRCGQSDCSICHQLDFRAKYHPEPERSAAALALKRRIQNKQGTRPMPYPECCSCHICAPCSYCTTHCYECKSLLDDDGNCDVCDNNS